MSREDPHDLRRFVDAQAPVYGRVKAELGAGRKASHWMWFVFPQVAGLGRSAMAERYAIRSLGEAAAYLDHALLGARLEECTALVNAVRGRSATAIFGQPDDAKFRSCMTLFGRADPARAGFRAALATYFDGEDDPATLARLTEATAGEKHA